MFDVLIIGGGVSGVSCALVLGSAHRKEFVKDKSIGIIMHQKGSMLQDAVFNNAYGVPQGTKGSDLLEQSKKDLALYSHIQQIENEKVTEVRFINDYFEVVTNKSAYQTKNIVIAVNSSNTFDIEGLNDFIIPHKKSAPQKNRIQLKNVDHLVAPGIYVAGTLAGHRSQLAIAAGSGAAVATDLLTLWNNGNETHSHDSLR
ncbi:MAG: FAD-dependent oxidoreductase [Flavobacteriaceae bacterium]|jgi:thioredoxin reductase|nr:FAD-dependent oxidoreductase [Flavobacteriaceae bacterium]